MAEETWPVHAAPRIDELTFANALTETKGRTFKGIDEIGSIWQTLIRHGVDPSFALGQFWAESLFGTAGWNVWSEPRMRSWGNILYVNSRLRSDPEVTAYAASNGYTYASYANWTKGVEDYCLLLAEYAKDHDHYRYGDTALIYGASAKWMAKPLGSEAHEWYLDVILSRMYRYDSRTPFEGEMLITPAGTSDLTYSSNKRYKIKAGDRWYLKPGGSVSYAFRADGQAIFMGQVHGTNWYAIRVMTSRFSSDGKTRAVTGYLPAFDKSRLSTVS